MNNEAVHLHCRGINTVFYVLSVQPILFGGWSLLRAWGRIGSPSHIRIDLHDSQDRVEASYTPKLSAPFHN